MANIRLLPQNLINLIAAGEVVERPASVLKELLENSIDAESSKIIVNLKDFGNELIEVKDNGVGMDLENAKLAFKQHATSKISSEDDLEKILSFGFRGEALASISSVAEKVELQTKTDKDNPVKLIIENNSEKLEASPRTERGTTISIHNIFKNIPARKKFLKSNAVELKHLTETFLNTALPLLNIHFEIYHNEKLIYQLTKTESFQNRVFEIWGKNVASNLFESKTLEINSNDNSKLKITGYFGKPEIAKRSYNLQYTYVNNRFVINKITGAAVIDAYKGFIHRDLKPAYFLFIETDPSKVDVNIHPRKTEVRFINSQEVFKYTYSLTKKTLENSTRTIINYTLKEGDSDHNFELSGGSQQNADPNVASATSKGVNSEDFAPDLIKKSSEPNFLVKDSGSTYSFKFKKPSFKVQEALSFTKSLLEDSEISEEDEKRDNYENQNLEVTFDKVAQIFNTYIIFEREGKLIFIDQHASAEKILFEKLYNNLGELKTKPLLIPEIVDLSQHDKALVLERREELKNIGIIIEDFGGESIQVLEIPEPIERLDIKDYIDEIVNSNTDLEKTYEADKKSYSKLNREVYMMLATAACHGSIRAGQKLEKQEMISIIKSLLKLENPYNCPHGRPTMWQLDKYEIEKNFRRNL